MNNDSPAKQFVESQLQPKQRLYLGLLFYLCGDDKNLVSDTPALTEIYALCCDKARVELLDVAKEKILSLARTVDFNHQEISEVTYTNRSGYKQTTPLHPRLDFDRNPNIATVLRNQELGFSKLNNRRNSYAHRQ